MYSVTLPNTMGAVNDSEFQEGLERLYQRDDESGIRPDMLARVKDILARLDVAQKPKDMDLPGYRLHILTGDLRGYWSVTVKANWRIIFRFEQGDAYEVELIDYY